MLCFKAIHPMVIKRPDGQLGNALTFGTTGSRFELDMDVYVPEDCRNYSELKALIRKKPLLDEIENTQEELQILRASQGEESKQVVDGVSVPCLRNGQNPVKGFIQIHYIKGYFLLKQTSHFQGISHLLSKFIFFSKLTQRREYLSELAPTPQAAQRKLKI
ncbi:aminopeptidase O [Caerostris extrusa]|uniref:Aminopeptidase O n=1 Tax=Caerostris extrusa TaxID=172846 RepID=A0AAV4TYP3_CAEEX|nr:aminopeptidase O [Caerostris extrusa]